MSDAAAKAHPYEVIARLWHFGHLRRPDDPDPVKVEDLTKLTLNSFKVRQALDSFLVFTGLPMEVGTSGKLDPLAVGAVLQPRCGCNDFEGVGELSAEEAATEVGTTGRGSWPANCHPDYPNRHTFTIRFDFRGIPSFLGNPADPNSPFSLAFRLCRMAYANVGLAMIVVNSGVSNCLVTWQRGAGWLGLATVGMNLSCGSKVTAKFDNRYSPTQMVWQWARLLAHEFGHNMGFRHLSSGIMRATLSSGEFTETAWRGDPGESRMRSWFSGIPVPLDIVPGPGPIPGPSTGFDWGGAKLA